MNSSVDESLNVTESSVGSAVIVGGSIQGSSQSRVETVVPMTFGLAVGSDGLMGATVDEAINTTDMSGPSVGQTEEVATTSFAGVTTRAQVAAVSISGKSTSLTVHISLLNTSGNQIK